MHFGGAERLWDQVGQKPLSTISCFSEHQLFLPAKMSVLQLTTFCNVSIRKFDTQFSPEQALTYTSTYTQVCSTHTETLKHINKIENKSLPRISKGFERQCFLFYLKYRKVTFIIQSNIRNITLILNFMSQLDLPKYSQISAKWIFLGICVSALWRD